MNIKYRGRREKVWGKNRERDKLRKMEDGGRRISVGKANSQPRISVHTYRIREASAIDE